jgi:hypothetical protein
VKDPRDRCIDAALAIVDARRRRAVLTRAMRFRRCERAPGPGAECFMVQDEPSAYCPPCVENDKAAEERREVKRDEVRAFARLRTAARALRGSDHSDRFIPMFETNRRAS